MSLSESELRKITLEAIEELGENATPQLVKEVVEKTVRKLEGTGKPVESVPSDSGRVILTSFGMNHPGIVAGITKALFEAGCDIMDISQKILSDFYTMMMVVNISSSKHGLKELQETMNKVADELKVKIYIQHEDVFRYMHRV